LRKAGANTATQQLGADIAEQLKAGHDVAYTAIAMGDTAVIARETSAPEAIPDDSKAAMPAAASATPAPAAGSADTSAPAASEPISASATPATAAPESGTTPPGSTPGSAPGEKPAPGAS
jgi:hypothetical protein